jgi:cytochrome P450
MPPNPSLWLRLSRGIKSSLALVQEGSFRTTGVGRHVIRQAPTGRRFFVYTLREPELIREVLVARAADFPKSRLMRAMLQELIGSSVFVENGETWRWRRAIVDQALEQARVREVMARMREAADALIARLDARIGEAASTITPVDRETTHFAADVIFRTLFSEPIGDDDARHVIEAFERYQELAYAHAMLSMAKIPLDLFPSAWRRRRSAKSIRTALSRPVRRRLDALAQGREAPTTDILASLIACADPETGRRFGEVELLDEVAMLFLAGHETSASALGWALYLLAITPEVQAEALAEVRRVLGDRAPEFADMKALTLVRNVFREALRLYPPVAQIGRDTVHSEQLGDQGIDPAAVVFCPAWIMHRQPRFWAEPDAFDPGRFETEAGKAAARDAYFPFSMGPRVCPGAAFALQEATLALAMLVRQFEFLPVEGRAPEPVGRLTLRSQNGVVLEVRRRG